MMTHFLKGRDTQKKKRADGPEKSCVRAILSYTVPSQLLSGSRQNFRDLNSENIQYRPHWILPFIITIIISPGEKMAFEFQ